MYLSNGAFFVVTSLLVYLIQLFLCDDLLKQLESRQEKKIAYKLQRNLGPEYI